MTSLWAETARLMVDASTTIAWRMPFLRPDDISPATLAERQKMIAEKVEPSVRRRWRRAQPP